MAFALTPLLFLLALQGSAKLGLAGTQLKAPPSATQVVAKVNGQAILGSDIAPLLWEWRGQEAIQDAISYLMAAQEAARKGIVVSDTETAKAVEAERASLAKSMNVDIKQVDSVLLEQGFTRSRLFMRVKSRLMIDRLAERGFEPEGYVSVATLIFKPASEQASAIGAAIESAEKAHARLKAGETWDRVLADTTKDPAMIKSKGVIGWKEFSAFPATVQAELKTIAVGGFTQPAQTANGIQIFRLDARGGNATGTALEALKSAYMANARQATVQRLRSSAKIERVWK